MGGLATAAGLFFAGYEIRSSKRERAIEDGRRREDRQAEIEARARSVSVSTTVDDAEPAAISARYPWVDVGQFPEHSVWFWLEYSIHNGGNLPIDDVVLLVGDVPVLPHERDELTHPQSQEVIGTIAAGATVDGARVVFFYGEPAFGELTSIAAISFTDAWGNYWLRQSGNLVHLETPAAKVC